MQMVNCKTLCDSWVDDFKKILFCMITITLGTLYNVKVPEALSVALVVQGISNVDIFWDYLKNKKFRWRLRIASAAIIFVSSVFALLAFISLVGHKEWFDIDGGVGPLLLVAVAVIAVASPMILFSADMVINISSEINDMKGGDDDER